jgi:hypothetical protein
MIEEPLSAPLKVAVFPRDCFMAQQLLLHCSNKLHPCNDEPTVSASRPRDNPEKYL